MKCINMNMYKKIIIIIIICIFLFPNNIVVAESREVNGVSYTYVTPDDNEDGADVSDVDYTLTAYGGEGLGAGDVDESALIENEKYGWQEYEENGVRYVVFAAATHEMLKSGDTSKEYFSFRFDHIHYFQYHQKIKFKFKDTSFDSNVYNGIILDSCGAAMFPQDPEWGRDSKVNILDVYFGMNRSDQELDSSPLSGQHVDVSLDGTFSQSAAKTANAGSTKEWWMKLGMTIFSSLGDLGQRFMDSIITDKPCRKQSYLLSEIQAMKKEIEEGNGTEESKKEDDVLDEKVIKALNIQEVVKTDEQESSEQDTSKEDENIVKTINLSKKIENKKGKSTTAFSSSTEIPVVQTDVYSMTNGTFELLDINFYNKKEEEFGNKKIWDFIRKIVISFSRICLYISIALLLTILIYRSITFILHIYERKCGICKNFERSN